MADYNRVILMGRLTRDPEIRYIPSGAAVCEVGMAVNDRKKDQSGQWVEDTQFIEVTFWNRTAELVSEYLSKGSPLFVEGRLKFDSWEKEGQKFSKLRVVGERMQFVGGREGSRSDNPSRSGGAPTETPQEVTAAPEGITDPPADDIPF
ncbi:MAG: single-stranded DNA-binding protein [Pirellulales bacterium]